MSFSNGLFFRTAYLTHRININVVFFNFSCTVYANRLRTIELFDRVKTVVLTNRKTFLVDQVSIMWHHM